MNSSLTNSLKDLFFSEVIKVSESGSDICPRNIPTLESLFRQLVLLDITKIDFNYEKACIEAALAAVVVTNQIPEVRGFISPLRKRVRTYEEVYKNSLYNVENYDIFAYCNKEKLQNVVKTLMDDSASRQAVLSFGDEFCTNTITYYIRHGELHAMVSSRSIDLVNKFVMDAQYFCILQQVLANTLGVGFGALVWNIGSLHIYKSDFNKMLTYASSQEARCSHGNQRTYKTRLTLNDLQVEKLPDILVGERFEVNYNERV